MLYELRSISRSFGRGENETQALRSVSLDIEEGEHIALVGPSGSGKTTLLNILGLLDEDLQGELRFGADLVNSLSPNARARLRLSAIGFVFQGFHLLPALTVRDNIALPLWRLHGDRRRANRRADELIAQVGIEARAGHHPNQLSGGEKQRAAVARAVINDPRVILADEPTGNLDADNTRAILDLFGQLNDEGKTLIVVSHNPIVASAASRTLKLEHGRLV